MAWNRATEPTGCWGRPRATLGRALGALRIGATVELLPAVGPPVQPARLASSPRSERGLQLAPSRVAASQVIGRVLTDLSVCVPPPHLGAPAGFLRPAVKPGQRVVGGHD